MSTGRWRTLDLDAPESFSAGDLAWEYLRRNELYQEAFERHAGESIDPHWGLRFRR